MKKGAIFIIVICICLSAFLGGMTCGVLIGRAINGPNNRLLSETNAESENADENVETTNYIHTKTDVSAFLYASPNTDEPIVKLEANTDVKCGAIVNEDWIEIIYNENTLYTQIELLVNKDKLVEADALRDKEDASDENVRIEIELAVSDEEISEGGTYTVVREEVKATGDVCVRVSPSSKAKQLSTLKDGTKIIRVGVGNNGWSKIVYNDEIAYVMSHYLTPTGKITYTEVEETVYATRELNVRDEPNVLANKVGSLEKADSITRIGVGSDGWSKVVYDGEIAYIYSLYLTMELEDEAAEYNIGVTYEEVNETVQAIREVNVRLGPSTKTTKIGSLSSGEIVTRIGIGDNNWSKILYNGSVAYVSNSYLKVVQNVD